MTNFKIPCKAIKCKFKLVCQEAMIIQVNTCFFYFDKQFFQMYVKNQYTFVFFLLILGYVNVLLKLDDIY
jgi:hypothetical protein